MISVSAAWRAVLLAAAIGPVFAGCGPEEYTAGQEAPVPTMSLAKARAVVRDTMLHYPGGGAAPARISFATTPIKSFDLSRVWVTSSFLALGTADHETFVIHLTDARASFDGANFLIPWSDPRFPNTEAMDIIFPGSPWPSPEPAKQLVDALAVLRQAAQAGIGESTPEDDARFAQAAQAYRQAAVKPVPGEDVRRYAVQAQAAVQAKDFFGAADDYEQALAVAPWWPQGHLNRAFILAEIGEYADAVREMQRYLALVPQAPDARQMQDQIYRWQAQAPAAVPAAAIPAPAAPSAAPAASSLFGGMQRALQSK